MSAFNLQNFTQLNPSSNQPRMPGGAELSEKLPDEIFQLVESFKKFVREQKAYRDQKFDLDPILDVDRDVNDLFLQLQRIAMDRDLNSLLIEQNRIETTKLLHHAELAYSSLRSRILDQQQQQQQSFQPQNLSGTQPDQTQYFSELADQMESRMKAYGEQIKDLKISLDSLIKTYNADELFKWLKKQHETLGEVAAKVYINHERILEKKSEQMN